MYMFGLSCVTPLHSRVDSTTPVAWSQDTSPEPCKLNSFRLGERPHLLPVNFAKASSIELVEGLTMSNVNEHSPAADARRDGEAKPARQATVGEGNVLAFRPKPARPPISHPPPPPSAA